MANRMPNRYVFFVIGTCLLVCSPILIFIIPRMIPITFYFVKYTWVYYVPMETFIVFAIGIALLIICCAILFFGKMRRWAIVSSGLLFCIALFMFYGSSRCYLTMADDGFTYRGLFEYEKQHVGWENVTQIERIEVPVGKSGNATYLVSLDNGDVLSFKEIPHVQEKRSKMRVKYGKYNIPVIYTN